MPDSDSEGIVSESDLETLTDLFRRFEGATDPLSTDCNSAKELFYFTLRQIYVERVRTKFIEIDFSIFANMTRKMCRQRLSRQDPPFPSL